MPVSADTLDAAVRSAFPTEHLVRQVTQEAITQPTMEFAGD